MSHKPDNKALTAQKEWILTHLNISALALELQDQISAGEHC